MSTAATVTLAELDEALARQKAEILAALPKGDPRWWKVTTIILPVVLTSAIGLGVWVIQSRLQNYLQTRLGVTQDYYRERLKALQAVHPRLVVLRDSVATAAMTSPQDAGLDDSIATLQKTYSDSSIFLSSTLLAEMKDLWGTSIAILRAGSVKDADVTRIEAAVEDAELQMRRDLLIDSDNLLAPGHAPRPTPAP